MSENEEAASPAPPAGEPRRAGGLVAALIAAFLLPGAGHLVLGRRIRGIAFSAIVIATLLIGLSLDGNLHHVVPGQPLTVLATLGTMGLGVPYFALRFGLGYQGDVVGAGYEYGSAFILTAGLMNILLLLDVWDVARGRKS